MSTYTCYLTISLKTKCQFFYFCKGKDGTLDRGLINLSFVTSREIIVIRVQVN